MQPHLVAAATLHSGEATRFSGRVRLALVTGSTDDTLHLYEVLFDARARTFWHSHSGEQVLLCLEGRCVVQVHGQEPIVLAEKSAFRVPAGVVHWHGALREPAAHLAVNIAAETSWLEAVSEIDYERVLIRVEASA